MAKIAIAIMLIFIASTHCALRDCSKKELVEIATLVRNAELEINGLIGFENFNAYETKDDLLYMIKKSMKKGGRKIQDIVRKNLLSIKKLNVYPIEEVIRALSKEELIKVCERVEKFARKKSLMNKFDENSWIGTIIEVLFVFAKKWDVSNEIILNLAFEVNSKAMYKAVTVKLNIRFLRALARGLLKVAGKVEDDLFNTHTQEKLVILIQELNGNMYKDFPQILLVMTDVKGWELLANSEELTQEELIEAINSEYKI